MIPQWWSFLLAGIGVVGLYITTRPGINRYHGYAIGLLVQFLWVGYAVATDQYGFLFSAAAYGAVNVIGIRNGRRIPKAAET